MPVCLLAGVPVASGALGGGELGSTGAVNPPPFLLVSTKIRQVKSDTRCAPPAAVRLKQGGNVS